MTDQRQSEVDTSLFTFGGPRSNTGLPQSASKMQPKKLNGHWCHKSDIHPVCSDSAGDLFTVTLLNGAESACEKIPLVKGALQSPHDLSIIRSHMQTFKMKHKTFIEPAKSCTHSQTGYNSGALKTNTVPKAPIHCWAKKLYMNNFWSHSAMLLAIHWRNGHSQPHKASVPSTDKQGVPKQMASVR